MYETHYGTYLLEGEVPITYQYVGEGNIYIKEYGDYTIEGREYYRLTFDLTCTKLVDIRLTSMGVLDEEEMEKFVALTAQVTRHASIINKYTEKTLIDLILENEKKGVKKNGGRKTIKRRTTAKSSSKLRITRKRKRLPNRDT